MSSTLPARILLWPRIAKRSVVVALDAGMGLLAMWLAFTLLMSLRAGVLWMRMRTDRWLVLGAT